MSTTAFASRTYPLRISSGILEHCQRIGIAVWVWLWFIDRTTSETEGPNGSLEGIVLGGTPIRASVIAAELGFSTRAVHEHIERLCKGKYVRRIDKGIGMSDGYAVQKSKKWDKNQSLIPAEASATLAEIRAPSQDSANLPRGNPRYPRGIPRPIRKTIQDNSKKQTASLFAADVDDVETVYRAYPHKVGSESAKKAIAKSLRTLNVAGQADPASFLIGKIESWKQSRGRLQSAGTWVPNYPHPATWFNEKRYNDPLPDDAVAAQITTRYVNPQDAYNGPEYGDAPFASPNEAAVSNKATVAAGLRQTTNGVHRSRAQSHQQGSRTDQGEGLLLRNGAVGDRPEDVRIKPGISCELLGIDPVALRDRPQLADVHHDDFVAQFLQLFADPDRVSSSLHRNPRWRNIGEPLLDRLRSRPEASPIDDFSVLVEGAVMAPDIAKVDADRHLNLGCLRGTSAMRSCARFFMGKSLSPIRKTCSSHLSGLTRSS